MLPLVNMSNESTPSLKILLFFPCLLESQEEVTDFKTNFAPFKYVISQYFPHRNSLWVRIVL